MLLLFFFTHAEIVKLLNPLRNPALEATEV